MCTRVTYLLDYTMHIPSKCWHLLCRTLYKCLDSPEHEEEFQPSGWMVLSGSCRTLENLITLVVRLLLLQCMDLSFLVLSSICGHNPKQHQIAKLVVYMPGIVYNHGPHRILIFVMTEGIDAISAKTDSNTPEITISFWSAFFQILEWWMFVITLLSSLAVLLWDCKIWAILSVPYSLTSLGPSGRYVHILNGISVSDWIS